MSKSELYNLSDFNNSGSVGIAPSPVKQPKRKAKPAPAPPPSSVAPKKPKPAPALPSSIAPKKLPRALAGLLPTAEWSKAHPKATT